MKKLKIAAYYNLPSGGARNAFENILNGLKAMGHQIDIYSGQAFQSIEVKKKFIVAVNNFLLLLNFWRYKRFSRKLALEINKKDYDIAIVTNSKILQHPFILRFLKIPKLLISQEPLRIIYEKNFQKNYVYKKYYKGIMEKIVFLYSFLGILARQGPDRENLTHADQLIVNSYFSKENFLSAYGILGKVVYPGIDTEIFKPASGNKRENCILSVGSYHAIKGHDLVIKALSLIPQNKQPLLRILGFGDFKTFEKELQYLEKLRDSRGLHNKVRFEKNFLGNNIVKVYQKSYLTIVTHFLEPFGLVPIESMACGTPVIAVREGGFRETIKHNKTGLLVERDPKELAEAILYLLENKKTWRRFSKNGPQWVKSNFSWKRATIEIEKILLHIVKNENRH